MQSRSESNLLRKPRYDHLYHSKPVPVSNQHKLIGPGQYDIAGNFTAPGRKEKFQFFGSTEVRFKQRNNLPEKGYSLLEMIKEGQVEVGGKEKKSPFKRKIGDNRSPEGMQLQPNFPGPGEYDPKVQCSKQSRRIAFFPLEQRFK